MYVRQAIELRVLLLLLLLGVHIVESKSFEILTDQSRQSFYRAANAIFGRVGGIASEEVVLHLMSTKCIPILLYGLELAV